MKFLLIAAMAVLFTCRSIPPQNRSEVRIQPSGEAGLTSEILLDVNDVSVLLPLPTYQQDRETLGTPMLEEFIGSEKTASKVFGELTRFSAGLQRMNQMKVGGRLIDAGNVVQQIRAELTQGTEIEVVRSSDINAHAQLIGAAVTNSQLKDYVAEIADQPLAQEEVIAGLDEAERSLFKAHRAAGMTFRDALSKALDDLEADFMSPRHKGNRTALENWQLMGFRLDPCAPDATDYRTNPEECRVQLRLVFQPAVLGRMAPGGKPNPMTTEDLAIHLIYSFFKVDARGLHPDFDQFDSMIRDIQEIKSRTRELSQRKGLVKTGPIETPAIRTTNGWFLDVHPVLAEEKMIWNHARRQAAGDVNEESQLKLDPAEAPVHRAMFEFVRKYAVPKATAPSRFVSRGIAMTSTAPAGTPWEFIAGRLVVDRQGQLRFVNVTLPTNSHMPSIETKLGEGSRPGEYATDPKTGISKKVSDRVVLETKKDSSGTAKNLRIPISTSKAFFNANGRDMFFWPGLHSRLLISTKINNPEDSNLNNSDCESCHRSGFSLAFDVGMRVEGRWQASGENRRAAFYPPAGISGYSSNFLQVASSWNFRAFGYFADKPTVAMRTATETAEAVKISNNRIVGLAADSKPPVSGPGAACIGDADVQSRIRECYVNGGSPEKCYEEQNERSSVCGVLGQKIAFQIMSTGKATESQLAQVRELDYGGRGGMARIFRQFGFQVFRAVEDVSIRASPSFDPATFRSLATTDMAAVRALKVEEDLEKAGLRDETLCGTLRKGDHIIAIGKNFVESAGTVTRRWVASYFFSKPEQYTDSSTGVQSVFGYVDSVFAPEVQPDSVRDVGASLDELARREIYVLGQGESAMRDPEDSDLIMKLPPRFRPRDSRSSICNRSDVFFVARDRNDRTNPSSAKQFLKPVDVKIVSKLLFGAGR